MRPGTRTGALAPAAGFDQARRAATNALKLDPKNVLARVAMAWIHTIYDWDWAGAQRELQQAATLAPGSVDVLAGDAGLSAALGRWDDGLRQAKAALAIVLKDQADGNALSIAEVYAFRGQSDEAMHWLERAYAQKDPYLYKIKGDLLLRNLEGDPRYKALLRKMNLPE